MKYNYSMKSIFNDKTLESFKKTRQIFLKVVVGIIIGEIVLTAILIVAGGANEIVGKFMTTLLVAVIAMFLTMSCFKCIEKKHYVAQILSLAAMAAVVLWTIFQILAVWEVIPMYETMGSNIFYSEMTPIGRFISIISSIMVFGLFGAWILSIEENGGPIKPLKITALVCDIYIWIFTIVVVLASLDVDKAGALYGLYGLACIGLLVTWISAGSISKRNRKEQIDKVVKNNSADLKSEEMQAQIREMLEKEVEARMAAKAEKQAEDKIKE